MIRRRTFLRGAAAVIATLGSPLRARLGDASTLPTWDTLRRQVGERLIKVHSPLAKSAARGGAGAAELFSRLKNPYFLGDEPGLTQTLGWVDAWTSRPSDFAVVAQSAQDVAAAVNFARDNRVPLIVKGGGHSYFGNSSRAGSLLVWTRRLDSVDLHDEFVPAGASESEAGVPAVSVGAGAIWGRVYDAVAAKAGRYVQGGGCLTVGVCGFTLGGGFGSFSKAFGTGAANLIEAEIVTADGAIRTVSRWSEPELFFALRGGGGGSFGIVTRLTLRTHDLPSTIGAVMLDVTATTEEAWHALIERTLSFYAEALHNPKWGEQLRFSPGRKFSTTMLFHGLSQAEARAVWQPYFSWLKERPELYRLSSEPAVLAFPGQQFWNPQFLSSLDGIVLGDERPGASPSNLFWATNKGEVGQVLHAYNSAWLPARLLDPSSLPKLVRAIAEGSRHWSVSLHSNKGLAGGSAEAIARTSETAMNREVLEAFALLISAAEGPPAWPGIPGHEPDEERARRDSAAVSRAVAPILALIPDAGTYMSEADYFGSDWQQAYWGHNYARLAAAKRRYDPGNLFHGHHSVQPA